VNSNGWHPELKVLFTNAGCVMKSWLLNELKIKEKLISDIYVNFIIPISSVSSNKDKIRFNSWNSFLNGYIFIGERVHKRLIIVW
jgi:short-subunit dehydrogenase involved in D-alanine esterification of teichoic acids